VTSRTFLRNIRDEGRSTYKEGLEEPQRQLWHPNRLKRLPGKRSAAV
jgi:hypothetical protein